MAAIARDFRARRQVVRTMPIRLWIESSSRCNIRCVMCLNKEADATDKGNMDFDLFRKVIDEARGHVNDVYLHHRGEPMMNPRFFDMIRYARDAGVRTRFHTNGTMLNEERCRDLLDARPDLVSFSIDGFQKQAYEAVRVGAKFETTVENVRRLLKMRREARQRAPYVVIEKIAFNRGEPPEIRAEAGALRKTFLSDGADEVIEKKEYAWSVAGNPEPAACERRTVCTFPWYAAVICWDGTVTPCPQDFDARLRMGSMRDSTLREIWNGDAYRDHRRRLAHDLDSLEICRKCDRIRRKTVGGVPFQYMITFLTDQLVGYNRLRRLIATSERN